MVVASLIPLLLAVEGTQDIPKGIRYKNAPAAVNADAKSRLERFFNATPEKADYRRLSGSSVVIGPTLWAAMKSALGSGFKDAPPVHFIVPQKGSAKPLAFEGKIARTADRLDTLWIAVSILAHKSKSQVVRKAKADELSYYWSLISYSLEEPLYVVDCGKCRFIVDFNSNGKSSRVFFVDLVGGLKKQK